MQVQGHHQLDSKFKASLGHLRPWREREGKKEGEQAREEDRGRGGGADSGFWRATCSELSLSLTVNPAVFLRNPAHL